MGSANSFGLLMSLNRLLMSLAKPVEILGVGLGLSALLGYGCGKEFGGRGQAERNQTVQRGAPDLGVRIAEGALKNAESSWRPKL